MSEERDFRKEFEDKFEELIDKWPGGSLYRELSIIAHKSFDELDKVRKERDGYRDSTIEGAKLIEKMFTLDEIEEALNEMMSYWIIKDEHLEIFRKELLSNRKEKE